MSETQETSPEIELEAEARRIAHDLMINQGLYARHDTTGEIGESVLSALRDPWDLAFDAYCIFCKREVTFRVRKQATPTRGIGGRYAEKVVPPILFGVAAVCQRNFHVYTYLFQLVGDVLIKIGQNPSVADVAKAELRPIERSLDPIDRRELGKALGLASHDTALGAFVYLRRVFERMIDRAHERQSAAGQPVDGFTGMRMHERIAALRHELPERVVRNSAVFSILSLGLHELTEDECGKFFPVMKAVVFQMLEQEEHKRLAAITERQTDEALQQALSSIGNSNARKA